MDPESCNLEDTSVPHFKHLEGHSENENHKDQLAACQCLDGFEPFEKGRF